LNAQIIGELLDVGFADAVDQGRTQLGHVAGKRIAGATVIACDETPLGIALRSGGGVVGWDGLMMGYSKRCETGRGKR